MKCYFLTGADNLIGCWAQRHAVSGLARASESTGNRDALSVDKVTVVSGAASTRI